MSERSGSPARSVTTSIAAAGVQLPAWVTALTSGSNAPVVQLTDEQKHKLDRARAFARQLTANLQREAAQKAKLAQQEAALKNLPIHCRVHVNGVGPNMTEKHLKQLFAPFGFIKAVALPLDPNTKRHKGFCYIDYDAPEAVSLSFQYMNDIHVDGRNFKIGRPANYPAEGTKGLPPPPKNRIYISNISELITEDNIKEIFSAFGEIERCAIPPNTALRKHKAYAYLEFKSSSAVHNAVIAMNKQEVGGLPLYVTKATVGVPFPEGMDSLAKLEESLPQSVLDIANKLKQSLQGAQQKQQPAPAEASREPSPPPREPTPEPVAEEANDEVEEFLKSVGAADYTPAPVIEKPPEKPVITKTVSNHDLPPQNQSCVVVLRNMVSPDEVDDELQEEVEDECKKFGHVKNVFIEITRGLVEIYVSFDAPEAAGRAIEALDGRWFGGRQVQASYQEEIDE